MELYRASNEWANRPDDERFGTLAELQAVTEQRRNTSAEKTFDLSTVRAEVVGDTSIAVKSIKSDNPVPAHLSHFAFGQVCQQLSAPASYLRTLPPTLATQNLNHHLATMGSGTQVKGLFRNGGDNPLKLRGLSSTEYVRVWDHEIATRLVDLQADGWRVPPARPVREGQRGTRPATESDVMDGATHGLSIKVGDLIAPAGIYASDRDMFVFLVNENVRTDDGLARGVFVWNSEVYGVVFGVCSFLYDFICGNHIVWGASMVQELKLRHVGGVRGRAFRQMAVEIKKYGNDSISDEQAKITTAKRYLIADKDEDVIDTLFGMKSLGIPKRTLEAAQVVAKQTHRYGDPRSAWGMVQGLTEVSQATGYADERNAIDRAAGKVLDLAFYVRRC